MKSDYFVDVKAGCHWPEHQAGPNSVLLMALRGTRPECQDTIDVA